MDEKHIAKLMKTLDIPREEAIQLINDDKAVDRMMKMSEIKGDMTAEQIKASKKYTQADRKKKEEVKKPTVYDFEKGKGGKKANGNVVSLADELMKWLSDKGYTEITRTKNGQIDFLNAENKKLRIVISAPTK